MPLAHHKGHGSYIAYIRERLVVYQTIRPNSLNLIALLKYLKQTDRASPLQISQANFIDQL